MVDIVNPFAGYRVTYGWKKGHYAIDYGMNNGTPFTAPADGTVTNQWFSDAGNRQCLLLADGRKILFAHLDQYLVKNGAKVKQGQVIGTSGNTGSASTGPHMHTFGLNKDGSRWNWVEDAQQPKPAAVDKAPFEVIAEDKENEMKLVNILNDGIYLMVPGKRLVHVKNVSDAELLMRVIDAPLGTYESSKGKDGRERETFNAAQRDRISSYLSGVTP